MTSASQIYTHHQFEVGTAWVAPSSWFLSCTSALFRLKHGKYQWFPLLLRFGSFTCVGVPYTLLANDASRWVQRNVEGQRRKAIAKRQKGSWSKRAQLKRWARSPQRHAHALDLCLLRAGKKALPSRGTRIHVSPGTPPAHTSPHRCEWWAILTRKKLVLQQQRARNVVECAFPTASAVTNQHSVLAFSLLHCREARGRWRVLTPPTTLALIYTLSYHGVKPSPENAPTIRGSIEPVRSYMMKPKCQRTCHFNNGSHSAATINECCC